MDAFSYALTLFRSKMDTLSKFDWHRLVPRTRIDRYEEIVVGVEITWPKSAEGLGIGLGLGKIDFWFGWPRAIKA